MDKVERSKSYKFSPQLRLAVLILAAKTFRIWSMLVLARLHLWRKFASNRTLHVVYETVGLTFGFAFFGYFLLHDGQYQKH